MKLLFYGADQEVTGSCHCVENAGKKVLIDCGMEQGMGADNEKFPFRVVDIDYVLVTHAHIDHSGLLPMLVKGGYKGPIYATRATCDLLKIMLLDSAHIQETEFAWKKRKNSRAGMGAQEPIYTVADAQKTLKYLVPWEYEKPLKVNENITAEFIDAGHLLGSASIRLTLREKEETRTIVFSGDIGSKRQPIIRDPHYFTQSDYAVTESTYGDRLHETNDLRKEELAQVFEQTFLRGGTVVIPAFAVGRTQELLYYIREIKEEKLVSSIPNFKVYVDSPLAMEATHIYDGDLDGYMDDETLEVIKRGFQPINFPNLFLCKTADESILLNQDTSPKVIISASGMCDAGRVRHHLKHNLWRKECTILFVGFQAVGTLGRIIVDGADKVKIFGEEIAVKAHIVNFRGMSAHADKNGLLEWINAFQTPLKKVFVVHGEPQTIQNYCATLQSLDFDVYAPEYLAEYDLIENKLSAVGVLRQKPRKTVQVHKELKPAYAKLMQAAQSLMNTVRGSEGVPNKDMERLTTQINDLMERWSRK